MDSSPISRVWYAIKTWKLQERIKTNQIWHNIIVDKVFNQYTKDKVVSKSVFYKKEKKLEDQIKQISDKLKKAMKQIQQVESCGKKKEWEDRQVKLLDVGDSVLVMDKLDSLSKRRQISNN